MLEKIIDIIKSILDYFFNRDKNEKIKEVVSIKEKKIEVEFKSNIEEIAKNASSVEERVRLKAIEDMRKLIAE